MPISRRDKPFAAIVAMMGLLGAVLPQISQASTNRTDHSALVLNLGVGVERLHYREAVNLQGISGLLALETEYQVEQPTQFSSADLRFNDRFALRFQSAGTLIAEKATEEWRTGRHGAIQRDALQVQRFELGVLGVIGSKHRLLLGAKLNQTLFERTDFRLTENSDAFAEDWKGPGVTGAEALNINDGTASLLVAEETWAFSLALGYESSNVFVEPGSGWRGLIQVMAATPVYYQLSNDGRNLTSAFNGYDLNAIVGVGWQFNDRVAVLATLNGFYQLREEDRTDDGSILPENELWGAAPALNLWVAF